MLAMVRQKEEQAKKLRDLRLQRAAEERARRIEIEDLKHKKSLKIAAMLLPEIRKYRRIVGSRHGEDMKTAAWNALVAKCPAGWADGVEEGATGKLLLHRDLREAEETWEGHFFRLKDGRIVDGRTGLQWVVESEGPEHVHEVLSWVDALPTSGGAWRLPTKEELVTLCINRKKSWNICPLFGAGTGSVWVCEGEGAGKPRIFNLKNGDVKSYLYKPNAKVFAVRP
jgi:hypothetical protein